MFSTKLFGLSVEIEYLAGNGGVVDYQIVSVGGKPCRTPPNWLYNKIHKAGIDADVIQLCVEHMDGV